LSCDADRDIAGLGPECDGCGLCPDTAPSSSGSTTEQDPCHIAIDGKTLRASKDAQGKAEHVLSAFCSALEQSVGHTSSRGKGREIPDALRLLETIDLTGMVITADAIFCQKSITPKITERGGDYLIAVKGNQKDLSEEIKTAFQEPVFPPERMAGSTNTSARAH
jgi:hypothetical protein